MRRALRPVRLRLAAARPRGASTWRGWPRPSSPLSDPTSQYAAGRDVADRASFGLQHVVRREPSMYPHDRDAQSFDTFLQTVGSSGTFLRTVGLGTPAFDVNLMHIVDEPAAAVQLRAGQPEGPAHLVGPPGSVASSYLQRGSARPLGVPSPAVAPDPVPHDKESPSRRAHIANFNLTPRQLKAHLDKHVISQEDAKRALSVAVCDHYNFVRRCLASPEVSEQHYLKPNVLLLGPSGCGKSHLLRALTKLLRVPFVKADATKFSATGYVGGDVDDMVRALVPAADGDVALAEFGIVYVDEVDKLAGNLGGAMGGGVSTRAVQSSMLKLMEDAEVLIQVGATPPSQLVKMGGGPKMIRTRHILFIMSGAFADLEAELRQDAQMKMDAQLERNAQLEREAQKRREAQLKRSAELQPGAELKDSANAEELEAHALGTEDPIPSAADVIRAASADLLQNPLASATAADLIRFGLEPEFVGRIPVRVACRALGHEELVRVLTEAEGSVLEQMKADFDGYGIELQLTEGALAEVARRASSQHTGARGLVTVLEQTLRDFKFELPSTNIKKLVVCEETVRLPQQKLEQLLAGERGATDSM